MLSPLRQLFTGRRALTLGASAALAAAVLAVPGELGWRYVERASNRGLGPPVDVVFVIDVTPSMRAHLPGLKRALESFAGQTVSGGFDARFGVVTFADHFLPGGAPAVVQPLSPDATRLRATIEGLQIRRGGDDPESSLDAVAVAARLPFRSETARIIFLVTDALPHVPDAQMKSDGEAAQVVAGARISQLHFITSRTAQSAYGALQASTRGEFFPLNEVAAGRRALERILPTIDNEAAEPAEIGLFSRHEYDNRSAQALLIAASVWFGLVAAGVALALAAVREGHASGRRPLPYEAARTAAFAFVFGAIIGAGAQALYAIALLPLGSMVPRLGILIVAGALIAVALARLLRSVRLGRAALVGCAAGAGAWLAYLAAGETLRAFPARLCAAGAFGLALGAGLARREVLGREVCLIVRWHDGEEMRLSLGPVPLVFGSSPNAHVHLPEEKGYPLITATAQLRAGRVDIANRVAGTTQTLAEGERLVLGPVELEVEAGR